MHARTTVATLAVAASLALAACGGDDGGDEPSGGTSTTGTTTQTENNPVARALSGVGAGLQEDGEALRTKAEDLQKQVQAGDITAEEAAGQIRDDAAALADKATTEAEKALDELEGQDGVDQSDIDEARRQLEQAKQEIAGGAAAPGGGSGTP